MKKRERHRQECLDDRERCLTSCAVNAGTIHMPIDFRKVIALIP